MTDPPSPLEDVLETVLYYGAGEEEAVMSFYSEVLGLRHLPLKIAFRLGDRVLLLFNREETSVQDDPPPHGATGPVHVCFRTDPARYDAWKEHLAGRGVTITREIPWSNGVRSFYFDDPAGNVLEIADGDMWPR